MDHLSLLTSVLADLREMRARAEAAHERDAAALAWWLDRWASKTGGYRREARKAVRFYLRDVRATRSRINGLDRDIAETLACVQRRRAALRPMLREAA